MQPLHLAYLSYEFPPHTAVGGIAIYTEQIVRLMAARGHTVEVFTAGPANSLNESIAENLMVHRLRVNDRNQFHQAIAELLQNVIVKEISTWLKVPNTSGKVLPFNNCFLNCQ